MRTTALVKGGGKMGKGDKGQGSSSSGASGSDYTIQPEKTTPRLDTSK